VIGSADFPVELQLDIDEADAREPEELPDIRNPLAPRSHYQHDVCQALQSHVGSETGIDPPKARQHRHVRVVPD
jgi:hypothetical protein